MPSITAKVNPDNIAVRSAWEALAKKYSEWGGLNIFIDCPHGRSVSPSSLTNMLTIHLWSAPYAGERQSTLESVNGIEIAVNGVGDHLVPSGTPTTWNDGSPIQSLLSEEGDIIAQYCRNTLYITFDIAHDDPEPVTPIMDWAVGWALTFLGNTSYFQDMNGEMPMTKMAENLAKLMSSGHERELNNARALVTNRQSDFDSYFRAMEVRASALAEAQLRLRQAEALADTSPEKAASELLSIQKLSGVDKVSVRVGALVIKTKDILIETEAGVYNVGAFTCTLKQASLQIVASDKELLRRNDGYDHPHVSHGEPCLGNMKVIYENLARCDFLGAVAMMLEYLKAYNPASAYKPLDRWPKVEAKVVPVKPLPAATPEPVARPTRTRRRRSAVATDAVTAAVAETTTPTTRLRVGEARVVEEPIRLSTSAAADFAATLRGSMPELIEVLEEEVDEEEHNE